MNDTISTESKERIFRRLEEPLRLFGTTVQPWVWILVLGIVLAIGFFYIGWMYKRDSKSIGIWWAGFLGLLRTGVYFLLALVFLMPAEQAWNETRQRSKVIVLFDTSLSMSVTRDDIPPAGKSFKEMPTRTDYLVNLLDRGPQVGDKVVIKEGEHLGKKGTIQQVTYDQDANKREVQKLKLGNFEGPGANPQLVLDIEARKVETTPKFIGRLEEKNPVTAYRFSRGLDSEFLYFEKTGQAMHFWPRVEREKILGAKSHNDREKVFNELPGRSPDRVLWYTWLTPRMDPQLPAGWKADQARGLELLRQVKANQEKVSSRFFHATAIGETLLEVVKQERNNMVEGIVIFTDGRLTEGSSSAVTEAVRAAADAKIPIFVVQVGSNRPRVSIDIVDIGAPPVIRPEDKFRVMVTVNGQDMPANEPFDISLDITRIAVDKKNQDRETELPIELAMLDEKGNLLLDDKGKERTIVLPKKITLPASFAKEKPVFKAGTPPSCQVEYELDAATLARAAGKPLDAGMKFGLAPHDDAELRFVARVPKDKREIVEITEHVSEKAQMRVLKKPLRVLLFASAATREYQFLRTLLVREMDKQRAEVCIHIQNIPNAEKRTGVVQDIDASRMLPDFPTKRVSPKGDASPFQALASYDVVVAFDVNWDDLSIGQTRLLQEWVDKDGGGLIVIGGQLNTQELASPLNAKDGSKFRPILDMLPVVLEFSQKEDATTDAPRRLKFPQASPEMEFMRLDEIDAKFDWQKGWDRFFNEIQDEDGKSTMKDSTQEPERGIFTYYPTKKVKDNAIRLATIDAASALLGAGKDQYQPWLASAPYGNGKVMWLASGETWRLRMYRENYHERFWTKLLREVGSQSINTLNKRITPIMSRYGTVNKFQPFEARFEDINGVALRNTTKPGPRLIVTLPEGVPAQAKDRVLIKLPKREDDKEDPYKLLREYDGRKATVLEVINDRDAGGNELRRLKIGNIEGSVDKSLTATIDSGKVEVLGEELAFRPKLGDKDELNAKNDGWFKADFQPKATGDYRLKVVYDDSPDNVYNHKFSVKDSTPEIDNARPDPEVLWELASPAQEVLNRIEKKSPDTAKKLRDVLKRPEGLVVKNKDGDKKLGNGEEKAPVDDSTRLLFDLKTSELIPDCMTQRTSNARNRGKIDDMWDKGFFETENEQGEKKPLMPYVLCIAVGLLSVEWLCRKLLRLA